MHFFHFSKKDINLFNSQHINLINNQNLYKSYINRDFRITNFIDQSCDKKTNYSEYHRSVLVSELEKKYFPKVGSSFVWYLIENTPAYKDITVEGKWKGEIYNSTVKSEERRYIPLYYNKMIQNILKKHWIIKH